MFSQTEEPVRLLMVHLSWHQAYCDLYRILLTSYREAAPPSTLQGINRQEILGRQGLCLQHAVAIVYLLAEFSQQCTAQTIDSDTAICAYQSSRIILFAAGTNCTAQRIEKTDAIQKARFCQSIVERYFARSLITDPLVGLPPMHHDLRGYANYLGRSKRSMPSFPSILPIGRGLLLHLTSKLEKTLPRTARRRLDMPPEDSSLLFTA